MTSVERGRQRSSIALLLSSVFPGLGQFYNRHLIKGAVFLGLGIVLTWYLMRAVPLDALELLEKGVKPGATLAVLLLLAIWLWSVVDAWRGADR